MKISFNIYGVIVIILLFTGVFYLGGIKARRQTDRLNIALYQSTDSLKSYRIKVNNLERNVFEKQAIIVSNERYIKDIEQEKERIKELNIRNIKTIGSLKTEISVLNKQLSLVSDTDTIVINDTIFKDKDCVELPVELSFKDKYAWANVSISQQASNINFGITNLDLHLTIGEKKRKPTVMLDTDNPYLQTKDIKMIVVQEPKKWHQRRIVWLGAGVLLGGAVF